MAEEWPLLATPEQVRAAIRAEMARYQVEQADLARSLCTTQQSISRRLTGTTQLTVDDITNIAVAIGCPVGRLLNPLK